MLVIIISTRFVSAQPTHTTIHRTFPEKNRKECEMRANWQWVFGCVEVKAANPVWGEAAHQINRHAINGWKSCSSAPEVLAHVFTIQSIVKPLTTECTSIRNGGFPPKTTKTPLFHTLDCLDESQSTRSAPSRTIRRLRKVIMYNKKNGGVFPPLSGVNFAYNLSAGKIWIRAKCLSEFFRLREVTSNKNWAPVCSNLILYVFYSN